MEYSARGNARTKPLPLETAGDENSYEEGFFVATYMLPNDSMCRQTNAMWAS